MDNSIYVVLSKQAVQFRKLNIHANNMANVNTPSYKQDGMMVTEWQHYDGSFPKIAFAQDISQYRNNAMGKMRQTGNPFDVALMGENAFFEVETPQGPRYTKAGNFLLDAIGTVVTQDGMPVLDANGERIVLPEEAQQISIREDGMMVVDGEEFGNMNVVQFENVQDMQRLSATLYATDQAPEPAENFKLMQGFVEESNVEAIVELTDMIETQRRVGVTSNFMDTAYDMQRRAVQAWSKQGNQ